MARFVGPYCKVCRREGAKLFLKGDRCNTEKCSFAKRPYPPGHKGKFFRPGKSSYYSLQLREKQKVKKIYGLLERQFRRYFEVASRTKGKTGKVLIQLLERRLDNVIFRLLYATSRNQARQIVSHGFVFVNGKRVNIPSYLIDKDDRIEIRTTEKQKTFIKTNVESSLKTRSIPAWLFQDKEKFSGEILRLPEKEDLTIPIDEQLIVELYSK